MKPIINIISSDSSELKNIKTLFEGEGFEVFTCSSVNEKNINPDYAIGFAILG